MYACIYIYVCVCVCVHAHTTYSVFNIATLYIYCISYPSQNHPLVLVASTGANGTRIPEVVPARIPRKIQLHLSKKSGNLRGNHQVDQKFWKNRDSKDEFGENMTFPKCLQNHQHTLGDSEAFWDLIHLGHGEMGPMSGSHGKNRRATDLPVSGARTNKASPTKKWLSACWKASKLPGEYVGYVVTPRNMGRCFVSRLSKC